MDSGSVEEVAESRLLLCNVVGTKERMSIGALGRKGRVTDLVLV